MYAAGGALICVGDILESYFPKNVILLFPTTSANAKKICRWSGPVSCSNQAVCPKESKMVEKVSPVQVKNG